MRAAGKAAVRRAYVALFEAFPDLTPTAEGEAYGSDVLVTWGTVLGAMKGLVRHCPRPKLYVGLGEHRRFSQQ